jgi:hypothetical protein
VLIIFERVQDGSEPLMKGAETVVFGGNGIMYVLTEEANLLSYPSNAWFNSPVNTHRIHLLHCASIIEVRNLVVKTIHPPRRQRNASSGPSQCNRKPCGCGRMRGQQGRVVLLSCNLIAFSFQRIHF